MNQAPLFPTDGDPGAVISPCGLYRYELSRTLSWSNPCNVCLFVMLNPSTADERTDDPTIKKCIGFARRWGFASLHVANLFAYRSPYPEELLNARDPVGPDADMHLERLLARADRVVLAWGAHNSPRALREVVFMRASAVMKTVRDFARARRDVPSWSVGTLGRAAGGAPRHPLMLSYDTPFLKGDLAT